MKGDALAKTVLFCANCREYTMKEKCPKCGTLTIEKKPPKFSPLDKWGKYRRATKRIRAA